MKLSWIGLLIAALALPVVAQTKLELKLDGIAARAKEKAEVDLDKAMLSMAQGLTPLAPMAGMKPDDPKLKMAQELLAGVDALSVRHYEFDAAGKWSAEELEPVRKQLGPGSGWSRMVNVKDGSETVEVYLLAVGGKPGGFLLMAGEPKELTVVYVQGAIELSRLKEIVNSNIVYNLKDVGAKAETAQAR